MNHKGVRKSKEQGDCRRQRFPSGDIWQLSQTQLIILTRWLMTGAAKAVLILKVPAASFDLAWRKTRGIMYTVPM